MQTQSANQITELLSAWRQGDPAALDQVMPVIYRELRKLASRCLRRERPGHTLQPTALINEAYLRLIGQNFPEWESRTHFYAIAAYVMRQVLIEYARAHAAAKRGGGGQKLALDEAIDVPQASAAEVIALDDALTALAAFDERKCRVVELRYFGGLNTEEMARVLGISAATVGRELRLAQAWLNREMCQ